MATRVTFVSGTAEVKRRDKRDARNEGGIESVIPAQPMNYVDGKCTCCPYGYHIDLDFVNFCQDVADGSTLSDLKRIQRNKRKLRKSMEVMLHQQQNPAQHEDSATATLAPIPPPDVVHSTEASRLMNMVQYEQTATHQVLRHIDSSVNATLANVDQGQPRRQRYTSSDSEDGYGGYSYSPVSPVSSSSFTTPQPSRYNTFPSSHQPAAPSHRRTVHHHHHQSNGEESSHFATSLSTSGRTDSLSSLSSVSTVSSEQVSGQYTSHASGMLSVQPQEMATAEIRVRSDPRHTTSATAMTVEKLASTMATHFPHGDRIEGAESPSSPMSSNTTISKASLAAIREAMAVSLQRMRDLEEQVKAIPVLQVRISVLKEEKRLLALQLKAKSSRANVRSIGVGDGTVDSPLSVSTHVFAYPTASSPFAPMAASPRSPSTLPKPSQVKTVGVGDHSVVEPYLLRPDLPTGYTITDNMVQTEIRTTTHTKDTMFLDRENLVHHLPSLNVSTDHAHYTSSFQDLTEARSPVQTHFTINQIQRTSPRPLTRSIGVGEANVHDTSLQIHEKELRTVIIGGNSGAMGKRNVGIEVRVPTRSVGVMYSCDDSRPATRTIGVNVNYDTSNIFTSLDFKGESELRTALRGVLQRNVRSIGINCSFQPEVMHTGVQHESYNMVSVGSGGEDCRVDVDIRQPVVQRSLGMMAKPEMVNRVACTEKDWVLDRGTNTQSVETYNKACSTESKRTGTASTNTEIIMSREAPTQTDSSVFHGLQVIKTTGVNTIPTATYNRSSNTISPITTNRAVNTKSAELVMENFDFEISFKDKAINTPKHFADTAVNTNTKELQLSFTKVECVSVEGEEVDASPRRPLTMEEHIIQRGASQAEAFLDSTSSSSSSTSPRRQSENESLSRTVTETVYMSPVTSQQMWTTGSTVGSGSGMQSEVFRSTSGGGGITTLSSTGDSQVSGDLNVGGSDSRSTITKTITSSTRGGDRFGGQGTSSEDLNASGSSGVGSYRSTITRTITSSVDGDRVISGSRNLGSCSDDDGISRSTITKTFTSSGRGGTITREDGNLGDRSTSGGVSKSVVTRTITSRSGGHTITSDDRNLDDLNASSGVSKSTITRTITGSGSMGGTNEGDLSRDSSGNYNRSIITKTISTSGVGDRLISEDQNQDNKATRFISTSEGDISSGFSSSLGGGSGNAENTVTKTFITTSGVGGGLSSGGGANQETYITKTIVGGDVGGVSSNFGRGEALQGSSVTRTITTSGNIGKDFGSDDLDTAFSTGDRRSQQSTVTRTITTRGDSGGHFGSDGGSTVTKTVTMKSTGGGKSSRTEFSTVPTLGPSRGLQVEEGYSDGKGIAVYGGLKGGTSYMERFGFTKSSNLASSGGSGQSQIQKISGLSSTGGSIQTENPSNVSSVTGTIQTEKSSDMSSIAQNVQTEITESSSQEAGGETPKTNVEVIEGTAVFRSSVSDPLLQSGQVKVVGGSSMQQDSSSSDNLRDMSSGGQSLVTESVVVKRSSSGGKLSKHRHSDGARLSREMGLDIQGAFSGRRVGSVEDFMPNDMRRFMNIEVTGSGGKSRSGGASKSDRLVTKTTKTVTTKRTTQDGKSVVSITKTITNPDGSVTTTTSDLDEGQTLSDGKELGKLSSAQYDLSKIASEAESMEQSQGREMKDSGCSSSVSSMSESMSLQGLDMSAMGSLERKQLKSIMKRSKSESASSKKGISFADSVVGGTGSSTEEEATESDDESTTSYDEGSYDGREGDITYQCRDDEAIAKGLPGAKMYDQNIRETYELSEEMQQACRVLAEYLVDSTTIQTKQLNTNQSVVQNEWFRVSSHKLSSPHQVEDYLSSINEVSHRLLDYIVNLVDNNGNAAIHYCVSHCNFDIVGLLLDTEVCDVRRPNKAGYTPAMLASLAHVQNDDHRNVIRRLFAASDINAQAEQTGQTALMLATSQCRADMVQLLLEAGADCNLQDFDGSTALMCACEHGHAAIAQLLLAHPDCDANVTDNENSTALSIAMETGHKDIGVILYKHLNFSKTANPAMAKKRKGSSSPTPRHSVR